jgi:hypothetical protein
MIIKKAVYEDVPTTMRREVCPEQHGCDQCKKPIVPYGNDERLDIKVFHHDDDTGVKDFFFCSWHCVFKFCRKIKTDYFFTLPYVCFDNKLPGRRAKDFLAVARKLGRR